MPTGSTERLLHLLTSFASPPGGSELRTLELYSLLRRFGNVLLWSDIEPGGAYRNYPARAIHPYRGEFPHTGTLVIVGSHTRLGPWLKSATLARIIVVADIYPHQSLFRMLEELDDWGIHSPEFVYASRMMQEEIGLKGIVEASPIALNRFKPASSRAERPFTVGRLSHDRPYKHHHDDPLLYTMLAEAGCVVSVMGGTLMQGRLGGFNRIELLPEGAMAAPDFLNRLDCFFYRTAEQWLEPSGRVVFEAMACGLPVVCGKRGGYAEPIRHGENGFLVGTQEEAFDALMRLRDDPSLRERIGAAARRTVEQIYDNDYVQSLIGYYLGGPITG